MWDFMADAVLGQIFDWIYGKLVGFFSEFFEMMNMMGAELFDLPWCCFSAGLHGCCTQ